MLLGAFFNVMMTAKYNQNTSEVGASNLKTAQLTPPDLEGIFPASFGTWREIELLSAVLPAEAVLGPGEAVTYRAYGDSLGRVVTLVVAYGPPAGDSVRLHRPEKCYTGQGFLVSRRKSSSLLLTSSFNIEEGSGGARSKKITIPVNRLMAKGPTRNEAVSYWLRAGNDYAVSAAHHQWINLRQGFGRSADGMLVRISTSGYGDGQFDVHLEFMESLLQAMAPKDRRWLIVE